MQCLPRHELKAILDKGSVAAARSAAQNLVAAVDSITKKRMSNVLKMSPDLVGTARFEVALNQ